jgi:2-octaprenylphenol hydroxylase
MSKNDYHVVIVGGGMVGAALACLLAEKDLQVALVDAAEPATMWKENTYDLRVSALTLTSINLFKSIGVWDNMVSMGEQSFEKMFVWDHFGSGELDIDSADAGEMQMGSIVENRVTVLALWNKLKTLQTCDVFTSTQLESYQVDNDIVSINLSNGELLQTSLLVGADGSNSALRQLSGIEDYGWSYQQKALVATLRPKKSHQQTAWQRFLPEGPLALLPLRDGLISIVWTSQSETTESYLKMTDKEFCQALAEASEFQLGQFELMGSRGVFPLKLQFSTDYCQDRLVLVGDAIHTIHPLAGQGANLGLKDVASLADLVVQAHQRGRDIASHQVLRRYERQRKGDNLIMMSMMDGIKRLFGADDQYVQYIRSAGMGVVNNSVLIKNTICKYAMGL